MADTPPRLPELPSELLSWLVAPGVAPSRALPSPDPESSAALARVAAALPAYLDHTIRSEAPAEVFSRRAWLAQLDQVEQARLGAASLDASQHPWAASVVETLSELLTRLADAIQAARAASAQEDDDEEPAASELILETPEERTWGVLRQLRTETSRSPLQESTALPAALAGVRALLAPPWLDAFQTACASLKPGAPEPDEDLSWWVASGLEARLLVDVLASELLDPGLFDELDRLDAAFDGLGPALSLLPRDDYEEITSLGMLPGGWVSWRQQRSSEPGRQIHETLVSWARQGEGASRRDRRSSTPEPHASWAEQKRLCDAPLARMSGWLGTQSRTLAHVTRKPAPQPTGGHQMAAADAPLDRVRTAPLAERTDRLDEFFLILKRTPCPWLREDLVQATESLLADPSTAELAPQIRARLRPDPGSVPLLLVHTATLTGDVWQLRIRRQDPGDPWRKAEILQSVARDAIRTAFEAAAATMPQGLPPFPFEEHCIELVGATLTGVDAIDGRSIGLGAALAFVSLWLDTSLPEDLACTGAVRSDGMLQQVAYLHEKAGALHRLCQRPLQFLVPSGLLPALPASIAPRPADSLKAALEVARLSTEFTGARRQQYIPWLGAVADRLERLERYHNHVRNQTLADYQGKGMDPWLVLGDRIRLLVDSLASFNDAQTRQQVARARADAALAFTHALDGISADQMLRGLDPLALPPSLSVHAGIVELGRLLDACAGGERPWDDTLPLLSSLERSLQALPEADRHLYEGRVLGTIGRVWMHRGQLSTALDFLRRAVDSHDRHLVQEAGRSRIYLATALRMSGDVHQATLTLEEASRHIERSRSWSLSYAEQTLLFWAYELARLQLDLDRPLDAIATLEVRLHQARQLGAWPLAGMLRTLTWAAASSFPEKQREALDELARIAGTDPFLQSILQEASGPFRRDGEVY